MQVSVFYLPSIGSRSEIEQGMAGLRGDLYQRMLDELRPDFVLALGRHDNMAETAHHLLDRGVPFVMEKPMSFNARQLKGVVEKAEATSGFAAVPLSMRTTPMFRHATRLIDEGTYGPICHFYQRMNRPTSDRYPAWDSPWMLDPRAANGGCLRNLGAHGLDTFVHLTGEGEDVEVTGAHLSWSTLGKPVEDYASVLVRSKKGVLGTVEVGNAFPGDGTDAALKVAFRDAILRMEDGRVVLETSDGLEELPVDDDSPSVLRRSIEAAVKGESPPVSVADCYRAVRLIDLAYIAAGNPYGTAEV
ncbi:MAG: Gfo/Idh/MocA family oxidoreductase [Chloroflexi bacterium]|nr:Gfo/Idh/MocA family oxidoreductase [Chloroflexota bacterium]